MVFGGQRATTNVVIITITIYMGPITIKSLLCTLLVNTTFLNTKREFQNPLKMRNNNVSLVGAAILRSPK